MAIDNKSLTGSRGQSSQNNREDILDLTLRPRTWDDYIGQNKVKQNVRIIVRAAKQRNETPEHLLFHGNPGLGKTTLAHLIAQDIDADFRITSGPAIAHAGDLAAILTNLKEGSVLFIDECLTGDTLVSLADGGVKKISEIKNNEEVIGGRVSETFKKKVDRLIEIHTSYSIIKCSENHPCIIFREGKIQTIAAKNLKTSDYFLIPDNLPHIQKNHLTPNQAKFIAAVLCDGHINKKLNTIQIETSRDKEYFKKVFEEGLRGFAITSESLNKDGRKKKMKTVFSCRETKRGTQTLRVYSHELIKKLTDLGIPSGKKSHIITIPREIFYAPIETVKMFIDTCFCCEGWVAVDKRKDDLKSLHLSLTSPLFLKELQLLLNKFGIVAYIRHIKGISYRLEINGHNRWLFKEKIGLSLKRKMDTLQTIKAPKKRDRIPFPRTLSQFRILNKHFLPSKYSGHFCESPTYPHITRENLQKIYNFIKAVADIEPALAQILNYKYVPIRKIEKKQEETDVYDFTTGQHFFVANGIITHNCHRLPRIVEEFLYPALENFKLNLILGRGPMAQTMELKVPRFTLIGATTRLAAMSGPLRSRFGAIFGLNFYELSDIEQIIQRSANLLGISIDGLAVKKLAEISRYTPRTANHLLKRIRDFAQVENQSIISESFVAKTLEHLEIDNLGLTTNDRRILLAIVDKFNGGPVGLQALAATTAEEEQTILEIYEPYLMRLGFISRTPRGRVATKLAFEHFKVRPPRLP